MLHALRRSALAHRGTGLRSIGGAPKVLDSMVALTVIAPDGHRVPLLARVGSKLSEALGTSVNPELAGAAPVLSPKHGHEAHVRVAHTMPLPELDADEARQLQLLAEGLHPDSRLASTIVLTPDWSGAVVSLAALQPYKSL